MAVNAGAAPLPWGEGKVEEFEPHQLHWPAYEERLTQYFVANGVKGLEVEGGDLLDHYWSQNVLNFARSSRLCEASREVIRTTHKVACGPFLTEASAYC